MQKLQVKGMQEFLGVEIPVIHGGFGENQKVMLAKTVAEIHGMELKTVNQLINNNIDEFEVGIDILDLKGNEDFKVISNDLKLSSKFVSNSKNIYLLSEQGYFALVQLMRSEKAKEIRKQLRREYFYMREVINSNEQLKANLLLKIYNGGADAISAGKQLTEMEVAEAIKPLNNKIELMTPAVETLGTLVNKDSCWSVEIFSKVLNISGMGRNNMFKWMRSKGILQVNNVPYQTYSKYFKVIPNNIKKLGFTTFTTLINYDGIIYLHKKLVKDGYISVKSMEEIIEELKCYESKESHYSITKEEYNDLINL